METEQKETKQQESTGKTLPNTLTTTSLDTTTSLGTTMPQRQNIDQ
jgi:chromosome segregation ATPase